MKLLSLDGRGWVRVEKIAIKMDFLFNRLSPLPFLSHRVEGSF